MCGNVKGSVVAQNTVRESNQRCVVVHGSHNLTISDNVAFDTRGHCYMTEDGVETENVFHHNIGAYTRPVERMISSDESDDQPSTFWGTNPMNTWTDNCAAGSEENGWWFEFRTSVRGPSGGMALAHGMNPKVLPLKEFRGNSAHSNGVHGIRTYPNGFVPDEEAVFLDAVSFNNKNSGFFFHNSGNLAVVGGIVGDNRRIQIDLDRSDAIRIEETHIIGHVKAPLSKQEIGHEDHKLIGIQIHGFLSQADTGAVIRNVAFSGFRDSNCAGGMALIDVDDEIRTGLFDYKTSIENLASEGLTAKDIFNFCGVFNQTNIYITDIDSSTRPLNTSSSGASVIIKDSKEMTTFLNPALCVPFHESCMQYCLDTCLKTVIFAVSPAETSNISLRVRDAAMTNALRLEGKYRYETDLATNVPDATKNTDITKARYFAATLPKGSYVADFLNHNGDKVWPSFVEVSYEDSQCGPAIGEDAVELLVPPVDTKDCQELIQNGDGELSESNPAYWLQRYGCGVELSSRSGINKSNAIADTEKGIPGSLGQLLDTRCLKHMESLQYEVKVWVRIEREGDPYLCTKAGGLCPMARLRGRLSLDEPEFSIILATSFVQPYDATGWNLLHGVFTVVPTMGKMSNAQFLIERGNVKDAKMYLDNVSISAIPQTCEDLVFNGDFETGDSRFWEKNDDDDQVKLSIISSHGRHSLKMHGRRKSSDSPAQFIRIGCMVQGERYLIESYFKLEKGDGTPFLCDPTSTIGEDRCPRMKMRFWNNSTLATEMVDADTSVALTDHSFRADGWNTMTGIYVPSRGIVTADKIHLMWDSVHHTRDIIIGKVSIKHLPRDCSNLIMNGNGEYSETPQFWRSYVMNTGSKIEVVNVDGSNVLYNHDRTKNGDGMHQYVDHTCLEENTEWEIRLKVKVISNDGRDVLCDSSSDNGNTGCPSVCITAWTMTSSGTFERTHYEKIFDDDQKVWAPGKFNLITGLMKVSPVLASSDRVSFGIWDYNGDWAVYIDEFSVQRTS